MAIDAPDGTLIIEIAITLGQNSIPPSAVTETAIVKLDRWTGSAAAYQTVVTYTVPADKTFILSAIEMACSDYSVAQFRITIAGVIKFADKSLQTTFNPILADVNLSAGQIVLIEARSDGSTSINVDAAIEGKEIG